MGKLYSLLILSIATLGVVWCSCLNSVPPIKPEPTVPPPIPVYTYKVVNTFPHDRQAYTQGLAFENGILYEGTGGYGSSSIRKVDLESGRVLQEYKLPERYFGEGITLYKDTLIQLTWKSNTGFVYDKNSLKLLREFSYPTDGWGITHDGSRIIMSDGTSKLYFLDPESFNTTGYVEVHDKNGPVNMLNELEYIDGKIFANVWATDNIVIIDPDDGSIAGWIDLSWLRDAGYYNNSTDVLNGIAYDAERGRMFVTGKLWPQLFEITRSTGY
ncbi:MAG: glutaminyl-peptide cyclotransferase [Chloroflexi bacterium]|nr:glutaminyl-peptide cyclotransferase [Chloroflexota bacterium]